MAARRPRRAPEAVISDWKEDYNHRRRHSAAPGYRAPLNDRRLDPHTVTKFVGQVLVTNLGGVSAIRLGPVGRLVRPLRHVFRSGAAVAYCGRRGPVDMDRYPLRGGSRFHQVKRGVRAGVGE